MWVNGRQVNPCVSTFALIGCPNWTTVVWCWLTQQHTDNHWHAKHKISSMISWHFWPKVTGIAQQINLILWACQCAHDWWTRVFNSHWQVVWELQQLWSTGHKKLWMAKCCWQKVKLLQSLIGSLMPPSCNDPNTQQHVFLWMCKTARHFHMSGVIIDTAIISFDLLAGKCWC